MGKLIVANWKMQFTHDETVAWLDEHSSELDAVLAQTGNQLVICPSYTAIPHMKTLKVQRMQWGGQDCGFEKKGAFTGDVSVLSLKELGCSYVIVGHSDRRRYHNETDERVVQKAGLLFEQQIHPIVCIGESAQDRVAKLTPFIIEMQLKQVLELLKARKLQELFVAYEPVWSIGTGLMLPPFELSNIISLIRNYCREQVPDLSLKVLYGGSVDPTTLITLADVKVDGFLLGKVSLDAELLKKIILSC